MVGPIRIECLTVPDFNIVIAWHRVSSDNTVSCR